MMGPLTALIARNHRAAAPSGIVAVGSKLTDIAGASSPFQCALPADCAAGDVVVLSCLGPADNNFTWQPPASAQTVQDSVVISGVDRYTAAVYVYALTASDVSAGSVGVPFSNSSGSAAAECVGMADVYRAPRPLRAGAVGTLAVGDLPPSPTNLTADGITTTADGALLQYTLFSTNFGGDTPSPPPDWTPGDADIKGALHVQTGHTVQSSAGPTGDITVGLTYDTFNTPEAYGLLLFALRQKTPSINLTHDLPALTVGQAWSGSVTATNTDGATGAITITASGLPAGITAGTPITNGDGSVTLPLSGTPTTAGPFDATFSATNGAQSASYEWVGDVAPPTSGASPTFVGSGADYVYPGVNTVPLPAGCSAGDYIIICGSSSSSSNAVRNVAGGVQLLAPTKYGSKYLTIYGYQLTATDITNGSISATVTYGYLLGVWHASNGVTLDVVGALNNTAGQFHELVVDGVTTSAANTVLVPIFAAASSVASGIVPTPYPSRYTQVGEVPSNGYRAAMLYADQAAAGATGDIDFGISNVDMQDILIAIKSA